MEALVSVIIPVYNAQNTIKKCLDSVIGQSYKNLDIIVVDNCSTDDSKKYIDEYSNKDQRVVSIIENKKGVSNARNKAIDCSRGKYIIFVDADDYLDEDAIKAEVACIEKQQIDAVFFDYYIDSQTKSNKCQHKLEYKTYKDDRIKLLKEMTGGNSYFSSIWRAIYKSSLIKNNIVFRNIKFAEDLLFNMEYIMNSSSIQVSNLVNYHYVDNESSSLKTLKDNPQNTIDFIGEFSKLVKEKRDTQLYSIYEEELKTCCLRILNNEHTFKKFKKWISQMDIINIDYKSFFYTCLRDKKFLLVYYRMILTKIKRKIIK